MWGQRWYSRMRGVNVGKRRWELSKNRRIDGARHKRRKEEMESWDFLYGKSSVVAALNADKRTPHTLMLQENMFDEYHDYVEKIKTKSIVSKENRELFQKLKRAMETKTTNVKVVSKSKMHMNEITRNRPHQGLVMKASKIELKTIRDVPLPADNNKNAVWLALDEVVDPQNLGALLRTAAFLGIAGVLMSSKNTAPLSPTVSKASSGALETMTNIYAVKNLPAVLRRAEEDGGFRILGTSLSGPVVKDLRDVSTGIPTVLVLGNEGTGLRTNVLRACTGGVVRIEGGQNEFLDSLNVSVAGGIALHYLLNN